MASILITGGAGFVGSNLGITIQQARPEDRVITLDNLKRRGAELTLPRLREAGVAFVHGDVRAPEDIVAAGPADILIECSAEPSVLAGYDGAPRYLVDTNLNGAIHCFDAARAWNAAVIFLSSSRIYPIEPLNRLAWREDPTRFSLEDNQPVPGASARGIAEDFPLEGARSLYGATKLCAEYLLAEYRAMYGLKAIVNRCGVIAGPWQMGKVDQGVVALWVARHMYGGALSYIGFGGGGKQVRDALHVDDLARLILYELDHLDDLDGKTFNAGGGLQASVSLLELTALCQEITSRKIDIAAHPETRPADLRSFITDNTRITAATGWRPGKDVRAIVEDIHRWIQAHYDALRGILG